MFWSCTAWGSGVALPHIHLQRYYPSIAHNHLSFLVFKHEVLLYRMNLVHWQDMAFMKIFFEDDNFFMLFNADFIINLCWPWLSITLSFRYLAQLQILQNYQIQHHHHHYHKHTHIHWTTLRFGVYQHIWWNGKQMKVQSFWKSSTNQCLSLSPSPVHLHL